MHTIKCLMTIWLLESFYQYLYFATESYLLILQTKWFFITKDIVFYIVPFSKEYEKLWNILS